MGKHFYGLMLFYTPNEDLSQIRFREKIHHLKRLFGVEGTENVLAAVNSVAVEFICSDAFDDKA